MMTRGNTEGIEPSTREWDRALAVTPIQPREVVRTRSLDDSVEATREVKQPCISLVKPKPSASSTAASSISLSPAEREIRDLLRIRLRAIGIVGAFALIAHAVLASTSSTYELRTHWFDVLFFELAVATSVAIGGLLCSDRTFRLGTLRVMELVIFGGLVVAFSWRLANWLSSLGHELSLARSKEALAVGEILSLAADSSAMPWVLVIVIYGTLIPNPFRRCVLAVASIATIPMVVAASVGWRNPAIPSEDLLSYLVQMSILLGIAGFTAVYGSSKMSELRQEVFVARKLGQYQLKKVLGHGGMGDVYLAEHQMLRRPCVLKVIRPERALDAVAISMFEREVCSMARLTHPNTVEVYDYGRTNDGTFYYTMEYLEGLTLQQIVSRYGPVPPARVIYLLRQICDALREAHDMGLIHRDIKPSNIMVCRRGGMDDVAKLLDFGLVRAPELAADAANGFREAVIMGTPHYMPPEQSTGMENVDERGDVYSLGCVAYFLLSGHPPYEEIGKMSLIDSLLPAEPVPINRYEPDVPADLVKVVSRCMRRQISQRFLTVEMLAQSLDECSCAGEWNSRLATVWWNRVRDEANGPLDLRDSSSIDTRSTATPSSV